MIPGTQPSRALWYPECMAHVARLSTVWSLGEPLSCSPVLCYCETLRGECVWRGARGRPSYTHFHHHLRREKVLRIWAEIYLNTSSLSMVSTCAATKLLA